MSGPTKTHGMIAASVLAVALCLVCFTASAQKNRFSPIGIGFSNQKAIDHGMSPLLYKGGALMVTTGFITQTDSAYRGFYFDFHIGTLKTRPGTEGAIRSAYEVRNDFGYHYHRAVATLYDDKVIWYAGGLVSNTLNFRGNPGFGNSLANYENVSSLALSTAWKMDFDLFSRASTVNFQLSTPVLNYIFRPNYSGSFDISNQDEIVGDVLENGRWHSINQFFRLSTRLEYSWHMKNGNRMQLGYAWDYYGYTPSHPVKAAMHAFWFTRTIAY